MRAVDLFAGLGGWDATVADHVLGIEHDPWACKTREAVGLGTLRADIALLDANDWSASDLLIASPPCQGFSIAGKQNPNDPRNKLVYEPMRWARLWRPRFIAFEQVPPVLPIWETFAEELRGFGYSAWTGILNAEQYGVPQTRRRAILMASTEKSVLPPVPTHSRYYQREPARFDPDVLPWVSMAAALGWGSARAIRTRAARTTPGGNLFSSEKPAWTLTEKARSWTHERPAPTVVATRRSDDGIVVGRQLPPGEERNPQHGGWTLVKSRPAPTDSGGGTDTGGAEPFANQKLRNAIGVRITLEEALILQGFRADYPVQGVKSRQFLQVGNAIPPPLAGAILSALMS